jgi:hypothetical protein
VASQAVASTSAVTLTGGTGTTLSIQGTAPGMVTAVNFTTASAAWTRVGFLTWAPASLTIIAP